MPETTKEHVEILLENFSDYVNPDGIEDPWFTLAEINQQFAWEDIPEDTLEEWLAELSEEGKVGIQTNDQGELEWRWLA